MANNLFTPDELVRAFDMIVNYVNDPLTHDIFTASVRTVRGRLYHVYSYEGHLYGRADDSNDRVEMSFDEFRNWGPAFVQLIRSIGTEVLSFGILGSPNLVQMNDVLEE